MSKWNTLNSELDDNPIIYTHLNTSKNQNTYNLILQVPGINTIEITYPSSYDNISQLKITNNEKTINHKENVEKNNSIVKYIKYMTVKNLLYQPLKINANYKLGQSSRRFFKINDIYEGKETLGTFLNKFRYAWEFSVINRSEIYFKFKLSETKIKKKFIIYLNER